MKRLTASEHYAQQKAGNKMNEVPEPNVVLTERMVTFEQICKGFAARKRQMEKLQPIMDELDQRSKAVYAERRQLEELDEQALKDIEALLAAVTDQELEVIARRAWNLK